MPTFRTTDDVSLSFTDTGEGRPVVLVHGYSAPASSWALISDAMLGAGYRVIAFDRRCHGDSETPAYGQRMARHGRDLGELLEHLDLSDVTLAGASMGGNAIWAYVDQFGSGRVAGVLIDDQTPKMINTADWPYGFYGFSPENAGTLFAGGIPPATPERNREPSAPAMVRLIERLGGPPAFRDPSAPVMLPLLNDHAQADWRDVVTRFDRPFVMLAGRESQLWPCEHAQAAVGDNGHGSAVVVEDCGHTVCFDQPDRFSDELLGLLERSGGDVQ